MNDGKLKSEILNLKGQTIDLYLPFESQGEKVIYNFQFKVSDIQPAQPN